MSDNGAKKTAAFFHSIRVKFLGMILVLVAALMLTVIGLIDMTVGDVVLEQGIEKGLAVARGVATASDDPLLTNDDLTLFTVIKGVTDSKGIVYGLIVGRDGRIKAHSNVEESGGEFKPYPDSRIFREGKDFNIRLYPDRLKNYIYDIAVPVTSVRLKSESIGFVHIGLSSRVVDEAVNRVSRYIKYLTIAGLLIGGAGAILITSVIVRPVHDLVKSSKEIGAGNLDYRMSVNRKDELGELMRSFNEMADGLKQKEFIRESFGRYVAPTVLDMILANKETWFKGKKIRVTVLFADIRGFTSLSERTSPENVISMLNEYFTVMTEIIQKHNGHIDKFIGDAIMAVFGSPVEYEGHALYAVRAACEMQEKLKGFNRDRKAQDHFDIGIGLNTGEVVAGNLGSIQKMEYAVIGDSVNVASRLCSTAKKGDVIISANTFAFVKDSGFEYTPLAPVTVKGKSEPLEIYSIIPRRGPDRTDDSDSATKRKKA